METKVVTWKGVEITVEADGTAAVFGMDGLFSKTEFSNLREAFRAVNTAHRPMAWELSTWDAIKDAVRVLRAPKGDFADTPQGIDEGAYRELLEHECYVFLRARCCLHLAYPSFYKRGAKEERELKS